MNDDSEQLAIIISVAAAVAVIAAVAVVLAIVIIAIFAFAILVTNTRSAPPDPTQVRLTQVVSGIRQPVFVTHAGDATNRLFIVSKLGDIYVFENGALQTVPFLNISGQLHPDTFQRPEAQSGLQSVAFDPDYANNGFLYTAYTDLDGKAALARYHVSDDPNLVDWSSRQLIAAFDLGAPPVTSEGIPQLSNGARHITFGPDGLLYYSLGDSGLTDLGAGLLPNSMRGTILRLDVNSQSAEPYSIPASNPFVSSAGLPEVWVYGLHNPWRFSFDRSTGDLYLGDVGAANWEEVDFLAADSPAGQTFGWSYYEGNSVLFGEINSNPAPANAVMPVLEYPHDDDACAIIGGYMYRGSLLPNLSGVYTYGDYCSGKVWAAYRDASGVWQSALLMDTDYQISSFGEDDAGELYLVDFGGGIYRFELGEETR
ncbi:MAG: PQQ-dependent sugar dehydrogenase [Burkholderiales bacterium]|nr:PQQ-dependent sugar dehydrogenase [Anaerolineae bacterium]